MTPEEEQTIVMIVENLKVIGRDFIRKSELKRALEEAFPEKNES